MASAAFGAADIRVLGPMELRGSDGNLVVLAPKSATLLVVLLLNLDLGMSNDQLKEHLWDEEVREDDTLYGYIKDVRAALRKLDPRARLLRSRGLLTLRLPDAEVLDVHRFTQRLKTAEGADTPEDGLVALEAAIGEFRGEPWTGLKVGKKLGAKRTGLVNQWIQACDRHTRLLIELGRHDRAIAALDEYRARWSDEERFDLLRAEAMAGVGKPLRAAAPPGLPVAAESATETFRLTPFLPVSGPFTGGGPSALLRAADQAVPFFGREEELARLSSWRDGPEVLSVQLIYGPGGQGKTRIAEKFAERAEAVGWRTLQALHEPAVRSTRGSSFDDADVLVVVDYAERWPRPDLNGLLQHVGERRPGRVRLLLVARQAGYWWKALANPLLKAGATVSDLRLGALAASIDRRRAAFAAARDRFAELLGVRDVKRLRPIGSLDDDAYGLALTLHMAAPVVVDAHGRKADLPTDPGSLSAYLVRREQDHWQIMADNGRITTRPESMARVVAVATLTQSLPQVDAEEALVQVGLADSTAAARTMVDDHALCYPPHSARVLVPLLPDRLGEDFLAEALPDNSGSGDPWTSRLPTGLITATAPYAPAALSVLVETAARWDHVRRDHLVPLLTRHPGLVLRAEGAALVTLAGFADHDLLVALTKTLPDRHVELDGGIAALARKLTDFGLVRAHDEAEKARLHESLAARLSNAGLYEDAVAVCREVIAIRRRLSENSPDKYEPGLADALGNMGIDLWHAGALAESVAAMQEAVDIYRRRANSGPDAYLDDLAAVLTNLTGALIGMRSYEEALDPAQEATETFLRLSKDRAGLDLEVASAQRNMAIVLGNLGRHTESLHAIESAVSRYRRLAEEQPQVHAADLAESLHTLGNRLAATDRVGEALAVTRESADILRRMVAVNPAAHEHAFVLALSSLANRLWHTGDRTGAVAADEEAAHVARSWGTPSAPLGIALNNLARHAAELGDHATALTAIEEAITTWRDLNSANAGTFDDKLARALTMRRELINSATQDERSPG